MDNRSGATITPFSLEPAFLPMRRNSDAPTVLSSSPSISSKIPYFRRLDTSADMTPRHQKTPRLTLILSSNSFLDSNIFDDNVRQPVYVIKTVGTLTTVKRSDSWEGPIQIADIRWPRKVPVVGKSKDLDSVLVQMAGGRWKEAGDILKPANIMQTRKFYIPNLSHSLRWKRSGSSYNCTCAAVKGPIATYEPAASSSPPRLIFYETLRDRYEEHRMSAYGGVSTHLLDHILITILLLVTDVYEWVTATNVIDDPLQPASLDPPTSDSNWRNMMYSEPVYPSAQSAMTVEDSPPNSPKDPTSSGQWADILYSDSMYPSQRRPSPSISGFSQASRATWDTSRPPGGSSLHLTPADSVSLQTPTESTYYDPAAPPVPEIPLQYRSSPSMSSVSIARSPLNPHTREVPSPLSSLDIERPRFDQSWPRPQSTPPEPPPSVHRPSPMSHSRQTSGIGRINSMFKSTTARQLPKPPQNQAPVPSVASLQEKRASHFPSRSLPPTPSGPSSSVPVVNAQLAQRQEHLEKEVHELVDWVQTLTSERHMPSARDVVFDVPPPAYNDINFSRSSDRPALH